MKNIAFLILTIAVVTSCTTTQNLEQIQLSKNNYLMTHRSNPTGESGKRDSIIIYKTESKPLASVNLDSDKLLITIPSKDDLTVVYISRAFTDTDLPDQKKYMILNEYYYLDLLNSHDTNLRNELGNEIKLTNKPIIKCDEKWSDYRFSGKLKYFEKKQIFQTIVIPFKIRAKTNSKPSDFSTGFNAGFAYGWQWKRTTIKPIFHKEDKKMKGYDKKELAFSLAPFIGLTPVKLNPDNTNNTILTEKSVVGYSAGAIGVFEINNFNLGIAFGFDHGVEDSENWDYQNKIWTGLVIGIDLIK